MTKTYIRSFVVMKYVVILPLCVGISFAFMMIFLKTHIEQFRILALFSVVLIFVLLLIYKGDQRHAIHCLMQQYNWQAYDHSTVIHHAFLLGNRMLVYDRKLYEIPYADLKTVTAVVQKKKTILIFNNHVKNRCSSLAQAQRFAAFLYCQNNEIQFHGIEPKGDGQRLHIEAGESR